MYMCNRVRLTCIQIRYFYLAHTSNISDGKTYLWVSWEFRSENGKKCTANRKRRTVFAKWDSLHFVADYTDKPFCLMCQAALAQFRASNLHSHFSSLDANIAQELPTGTEIRTHKFMILKSQVKMQSQLQKIMKHSETGTLASYGRTWNIARTK